MTMQFPVQCWLVVSVVVCSLMIIECCDVGEECGYKSNSCVNNTCGCPVGYTLHSNGLVCGNSSCTESDCLECSSAALCNRCVYFIEEGSRECLEKCVGEAKISYSGSLQGSICVLGQEDDDNDDVIIGVVAGISSGVLLCVVVVVAFCFHMKRTRRKVNLNQKHYAEGNMQTGMVKKVPMYDNRGFDLGPESLVHNLIDRDVYLAELEKLKPHAQTLLIILNEIRHKLRAMDKSDPRVSTYKGVIHQLCRVLVIVHKKDPGASIPSDALGLMEWAHQMIDDRQLGAQESEEIPETPVNKISYIEVPEPVTRTTANTTATSFNPYATPIVSKSNTFASLKRNSQPTFYSSVPVPVDLNTNPQVNHLSVSQNNSLKRQYEIPWDLKKPSGSFSSLSCSKSDLTMGYFANGRIYDPGPHPVMLTPQPEVYAPASSYSDRSHAPGFSTFAGGLPRTQSSSSTHTSASSNDVDPDEPMDEGLPFDLVDATDPVEV